MVEALKYAIKDLDGFVNEDRGDGLVVAPDSVWRKRLAMYRATLKLAQEVH
jgi:hypothetical protein